LKLNRIELKKVSYDFNNIANRFMRVDYHEYTSVLAKFLAHIDSVEIISEYIKDCGKPTYNVKAEIDEVGSGRAIFELGDTEQEEVANIYHILKYCFENNVFIPHTIARSYGPSTKWKDMTKNFNERVLMVFIRHIEAYLTKIGIDMGMDEHISYLITVNNGQVNLALDNAIINAVQNNGVDAGRLKELIKAIREELPMELSPEDSETVGDNLEVVESELSNPNPRRGFIKTALTGLKAIKGTAEFGAAVVELAQYLGTFL
jgi:hypothetical protein